MSSPERRIAPEFVQDALEPKAVANALEPLLNLASDERRRMVEALNAVRASLGQPGAAGRVAAMALDLARQTAAPRAARAR